MMFTPLGEKPRWQIVYDLLVPLEPGEVLTYEAMGEALNLDPAAATELRGIQMSIRRAGKELLEKNLRAVESVPTVGYRVVDPAGHLELAKHHQGRASRSLRRGQDMVEHVDLNGLDPVLRRAFEVMAYAFSAQLEINRAMDVRQAKLEKVVAQVSSKSAKTADEVDKLKARLAALEEKFKDS